MKFFILAIGLMFLPVCGCASRHVIKGGIDMVIPRSALTADPVLKGCDTTSPTPKCKKIVLQYKKGSEQLAISK